MGFLRMEMRRGSTRPWTGTVVNARTGAPVDLRDPDVTVSFTATVREGEEPIIEKDRTAGITVAPDNPGNVYTISWVRDDTIDIEAELLSFSVIVVEPDDEGDSPVHGTLAISSS